jgi:hypothetical protein
LLKGDAIEQSLLKGDAIETQFWKRITKRLSQSNLVLFGSIISEKMLKGFFSKVTLLYINRPNKTFYRKAQKISWTTHCHADAI